MVTFKPLPSFQNRLNLGWPNYVLRFCLPKGKAQEFRLDAYCLVYILFFQKCQHLIFPNQSCGYTDIFGILNINGHPLRTNYKTSYKCYCNHKNGLNHNCFPVRNYLPAHCDSKYCQHCKHAIFFPELHGDQYFVLHS